jgi:hypothetical protein
VSEVAVQKVPLIAHHGQKMPEFEIAYLCPIVAQFANVSNSKDPTKGAASKT